MGAEAVCKFTLSGKRRKGKVRLETDVLQLRVTDVSLSVPFKRMKQVRAAERMLSFSSPDGVVTLELGPAAARSADRILHPPSRLEKIGGRSVKNCDAIFFGATAVSRLSRLPAP